MRDDTFRLRRRQLIAFLRNLPPDLEESLARTRARAVAQSRRRDLLWYSLLGAMSTLGSSRGHAGLFGDADNRRSVEYGRLRSLTASARHRVLESTLRRAKVRMPAQKARWLSADFDIIEENGGPAKMLRRARRLNGSEEKMRFMRQFYGIGPKYSRDIWMDIADPDFDDRIALDVRVQTISRALGLRYESYEEHERFYQNLAQQVGRTVWQLDRLFYGHKDRVLEAMGVARAANRPGPRHRGCGAKTGRLPGRR